MLTYPTTADTPTQVAILPDWGTPVRQTTAYRTDVTRSRSGLEQRSQRRRKPTLTMEYEFAHDGQQAMRRIEEIVAITRGPLWVPWWPHGLSLATGMINDTGATLNGTPIGEEWDLTGLVYLWHRDYGGEWRALASRVGQVLTLTDTGTHTRFPAGAFAFPVRLAVRDRDNAALLSNHHQATIERLSFRTL